MDIPPVNALDVESCPHCVKTSQFTHLRHTCFSFVQASWLHKQTAIKLIYSAVIRTTQRPFAAQSGRIRTRNEPILHRGQALDEDLQDAAMATTLTHFLLLLSNLLFSLWY